MGSKKLMLKGFKKTKYSKRIKKVFWICIELLFLILFTYLFFRHVKIEEFANIKIFNIYEILLIIVVHFMIYVFSAFGWHMLLKLYYPEISFWQTFTTKLSSYAISLITPFIGVGGDFVAPFLLKKDHRHYTQLYATVALERLIEASSFLLMLSLFSFFILHLEINNKLKILMGIAAFGGLFILSYLFFILSKKKRVLSNIFIWVGKILRLNHFSWFERAKNAIIEFEKEIFMILKPRNKKVIFFAVLFKFLAFLFDVLRITAILFALGYRKQILFKSVLIISTYLIIWVFSFIPASLGGFELISLEIFETLGYSKADGLTYIITIRLLSLFLVILGLINYFLHRSKLLWRNLFQNPLKKKNEKNEKNKLKTNKNNII